VAFGRVGPQTSGSNAETPPPRCAQPHTPPCRCPRPRHRPPPQSRLQGTAPWPSASTPATSPPPARAASCSSPSPAPARTRSAAASATRGGRPSRRRSRAPRCSTRAAGAGATGRGCCWRRCCSATARAPLGSWRASPTWDRCGAGFTRRCVSRGARRNLGRGWRQGVLTRRTRRFERLAYSPPHPSKPLRARHRPLTLLHTPAHAPAHPPPPTPHPPTPTPTPPKVYSVPLLAEFGNNTKPDLGPGAPPPGLLGSTRDTAARRPIGRLSCNSRHPQPPTTPPPICSSPKTRLALGRRAGAVPLGRRRGGHHPGRPRRHRALAGGALRSTEEH
jgi:hypothetical protein